MDVNIQNSSPNLKFYKQYFYRNKENTQKTIRIPCSYSVSERVSSLRRFFSFLLYF